MNEDLVNNALASGYQIGTKAGRAVMLDMIQQSLIRALRESRPKDATGNNHRTQQWKNDIFWIGHSLVSADPHFARDQFERDCYQPLD